MKKYELIYHDIVEQIINGELKLGGDLKSEIYYQKKYNASRFTVRNAISKLDNEGYIKKTRGRPSTIINNVPRRKNILLIMQFMGSYLFGELVYNIERTLKEAGYNTIISFSYSDKQLEKQNLENLLPIADGIIIDPTQTYKYQNEFLDVYQKLTTKPSISMSSPILGVDIPSLLTNDFDVMERITKKIVAKGNNNILVIAREVDLQGYWRLQGIMSVIESADVEYQTINYTTETASQVAKITLDLCLKNRFDTIMFFSDQCAYAFVELAEFNNFNLEHIIITGFDGVEYEKCKKKVVSPIYPKNLVASDAATMIIRQIEGEKVKGKTYQLEVLNEELLN